MGNTLLPPPDSQPCLTSQPSFSTKYSILSQDFDHGIWHLKSTRNPNQFILKQHSTNLESLHNKNTILSQRKISDKNPYILQLEDYYQEKQNNYCSVQFKTYFVFEKPYKDLRAEMKERRLKKSGFDKEELLSIIETGALGLKYLKQINQPPHSIDSSTIFLSTDGVILLSDPWLQESNSKPSTHTYPSPQYQQFYNRPQQEQFDWVTSHLFSLGMVVLEMYYLQFMDEVYQGKEINYSVLSQKADGIKDKELRQFVDQLLGSKRKRLMVVSQIQIYANNQKRESQQGNKKEVGEVVKVRDPTTPNPYVTPSPLSELKTNTIPPKTALNSTNNSQFANKPCIKPKVTPPKQPENERYTSSAVSLKSITQPKSFSEIRSTIYNSLHHSEEYRQPQDSRSSTSSTPSFYQLPSIVITPAEDQLVKQNTSALTQAQSSNHISSSFNTSSQTLNQTNIQQSLDEDTVKSPVYIIHNYSKINQCAKTAPTQESLTKSEDEVVTSKNYYHCDYLMRSQEEEEKYNEDDLKEDQGKGAHTNQSSPATSYSPLLSQDIEQDPQQPVLPVVTRKQRSNRVNSVIMEVSDSENRSQGQREIDQIGILYSHSPPVSTSDLGKLQLKQGDGSQMVVEHYEEGSRYQGQKLNGMKNGFGKFVYQDGAYVEGTWKNNQLHGEGKLYYSNGKLAYDGEYDMGEFHGYGRAYNNQPIEAQESGIDYKNFGKSIDEWESYQGHIKHEQKHGRGKLTYSNGEYFQGDFKLDKMNGKGRFTRSNGQQIRGIWIDNILIQLI